MHGDEVGADRRDIRIGRLDPDDPARPQCGGAESLAGVDETKGIDLLEVGFPSDAEAFHARYELLETERRGALSSFLLAPRNPEARQLLRSIRLEVDEEGNLVGDFLGSRAFTGTLDRESLEKGITQFGVPFDDILRNTEFTIDGIMRSAEDRPELEAFHGRFYRPAGAVLVVAGDVDPKEVLRLARRYFGPLEGDPIRAPKPRREPEQIGVNRILVKAPARQPYLLIGFKTPVLNGAERDWEPYALEMLEAILAGAAAAFSENGFAATTMRQIAQASGSSLGGIYHHFDSMEAAKSFMESPRLQEVMKAAGVQGTPDVWFATRV